MEMWYFCIKKYNKNPNASKTSKIQPWNRLKANVLAAVKETRFVLTKEYAWKERCHV